MGGGQLNSYAEQGTLVKEVGGTIVEAQNPDQQLLKTKEEKLSLLLFAASILSVAFWIVVNLTTDNAFHSDTVEQINWSKSFEWGYWKHPPFSTMLLILLNHIIGVHAFNTVILDFIVLSSTLYFAWRISCMLLGDTWGGVSVLLLSANYCFSIKAILYNHNDALIFATSACIWSILWTIKNAKSNTWAWILNGILVGLSLLTKYQAVVSLLGVLIAMKANNYFGDKEVRRGSIIAGCSMLAILTPHILWIFNTHYLILDYTVGHARPSNLPTRIAWFLRFILNQFKFYWVGIATLLIGALAGGLHAKQPPQLKSNTNTTEKEELYWLLGLCGIPALMSLVTLVAFGIYQQSHWGFSFFLFYPTLVCWILKKYNLGIRGKRLLYIFTGLTVINAIFFIGFNDAAHARENPSEIHYQHARMLAQQGVQEWEKVTRSPLLYIKGDEYIGGIVSAYSGLNPVVTSGNFRQIPWITKEELKRAGYLSVERLNDSHVIFKAHPPT
jgi:4-amino-4-deoxy-L-arabinose transferase-like glycosyltransferase